MLAKQGQTLSLFCHHAGDKGKEFLGIDAIASYSALIRMSAVLITGSVNYFSFDEGLREGQLCGVL
jgi:hypothetical protein